MRPGTVPDTTPTRKENSVRGQVFIRLLPQCHLPLLPLSGSFRAPEFLPALKRAVLSNPTAGEWNRPGHTPLLLTSLPVSKRAGGGTCPSSVSFKLHIHVGYNALVLKDVPRFFDMPSLLNWGTTVTALIYRLQRK